MLLSDLTPQQLDAASTLLSDEGFKSIIQYIAEEVTNLSLKSVSYVGEEGDKLKGACIAMQELRDNLIFSREIIKAREEEVMMGEFKGDTVSP